VNETCYASSFARKNIYLVALSFLAISCIVLGDANAILLNLRSEPSMLVTGIRDLVLDGYIKRLW